MGLVVLIAIGVTVGVVVSKNNKSDTKSSGSSSSGGTKGGDSSNPGGDIDLSDPSNFKKDDRLHKSFYGMAYTPHNALLDFGCGNTLGKPSPWSQVFLELTIIQNRRFRTFKLVFCSGTSSSLLISTLASLPTHLQDSYLWFRL